MLVQLYNFQKKAPFLGGAHHFDVNFQKKGSFLGCAHHFLINFQKKAPFLGSQQFLSDSRPTLRILVWRC